MRRRLDWSTDFPSAPRDRALRIRIVSRIEGDPAFWLRRDRPGTLIVVDVQAGGVTLNGYVRTASERRRVEALARHLGAHSVDNRLRILNAAEDVT